ncbi:hypothetical protein OIO90_003259 [Microbotryomycetes sp. JL221]|nr:hypothetical protein OIO90_003259 [Microbotryomycetes sp. JL221]
MPDHTLPPQQDTKAVTISLPPTATRVLEKYGTYHAIFATLFAKSVALASQSTSATTNEAQNQVNLAKRQVHELTIESYDAVHQVMPDSDSVRQADAVLITGSASSAYEDIPWISNLVEYTSRLPDVNPSLKIFGICFGHQIVARAFGSTVERNAKGWEIGVRSIDLTQVGKDVFGSEQLTVHQMHRDHVPELPAGFESLGSTKDCSIHGMVRFRKRSDTQAKQSVLDDIDVITLQGHPEFTPDMVNKIIDAREQGKVISKQVADESRQFALERDQGIEIGRLLLKLLHV